MLFNNLHTARSSLLVSFVFSKFYRGCEVSVYLIEKAIWEVVMSSRGGRVGGGVLSHVNWSHVYCNCPLLQHLVLFISLSITSFSGSPFTRNFPQHVLVVFQTCSWCLCNMFLLCPCCLITCFCSLHISWLLLSSLHTSVVFLICSRCLRSCCAVYS